VSVNAARDVADALRAIRVKAESEAPQAACTALGQAAQTTVKVMLTARSHDPGTPTPSGKGQPPAKISGDLAKSAHRTTARIMSPGIARCALGVMAPYASVHEFGPVTIHAKNFPQLGNPDVGFFGKEVTIPRRPFMVPAVLLLESTGMAGQVTTDAWRSVIGL
jgi:hypothetical protein